MKYVKTENWSVITPGHASGTPKVGQWIVNDYGQRGQFLGVTWAGVVVVRYQQNDGAKFSKRDAKNNKTLRAFAKNYGAK